MVPIKIYYYIIIIINYTNDTNILLNAYSPMFDEMHCIENAK